MGCSNGEKSAERTYCVLSLGKAKSKMKKKKKKEEQFVRNSVGFITTS